MAKSSVPWIKVWMYGIDLGFDHHRSSRLENIVHYRCRRCGYESTVHITNRSDIDEIEHHLEFHFSHCPKRERGQP